MKRFIICLAILIFIPFPTLIKAMIIAPPPSCDAYKSGLIAGATYSLIGLPQYENGFLILHFGFNAPSNQRDISYLSLLMAHDNCAGKGAFSSVAVIPSGINIFSIRFGSNNSFSFYDDINNIPLTCDGCSNTFSADPNSNYKIQFLFSNDFNNDFVRSRAYDINNPNPESETPVLIIPGTLGSQINKQNQVLWPDIPKMINPLESDAFMDPLAFNADGVAIDTSLTVPDILREPYAGQHFYDGIIQSFKDQGYEENIDLFVFPYDWRDDIAKIAHNEMESSLPPAQRTDLAGKIDQVLLATGANKVDIIAHSQGGLLAKRLLFDEPSYQAKIRKLVLVGVPNLGAPNAAKILLYGDSLNVAKSDGIIRGQLDPEEIKKIALNMPSVYELLPSQSYFINQPLGYIYDHNKFYLNTYQKSSDYLKQNNLNSTLVDSATSFHNFNYDNFDFSSTGIEVFNIAGCEQGTIGTLVIKADSSIPGIRFTAGDGTVPLTSASKVVGATNYFVTGAINHAKMLTHASIMPLATDLITGVLLPLPSDVVTNSLQCHFNGTEVTIHSPVDLDIYDESGNHVGISRDANNPFIDLGVAGAQYEEIGHNKYAFLPSGHTYNIKLAATGVGSFSFDSSIIQEGDILNTAHYNSVVITASSTAQISLNPQNNQSIQLDINGDGVTDQIIQPSSILDADKSQDIISPVSTSTIMGLMGQEGFYRSNATITLSAMDPVIQGRENETSGILKTQYSLDGGEYQIYSSSLPISVTGEGAHNLIFYATDRAGNNEEPQEINFVIDRTPPELIIQFDPLQKDLAFFATDSLPSILTATSTYSKVKLSKIPILKFTDSDNVIVATDAAGNVTQLTLKDKDRKHHLKADVASLSYNGQNQDISKNLFHFDWQYDKANNLKALIQQIQSKKDFKISAVYKLNKTLITGKDQNGKINNLLNGLALLNVTSNKGDFNWDY